MTRGLTRRPCDRLSRLLRADRDRAAPRADSRGPCSRLRRCGPGGGAPDQRLGGGERAARPGRHRIRRGLRRGSLGHAGDRAAGDARAPQRDRDAPLCLPEPMARSSVPRHRPDRPTQLDARARAATFARTTTSATSSMANGSTRASPIPRRSSTHGDPDLERGQGRKYDRILDRLGDRERVLEIGCGWGGFAERAAGRGHAVTAITVSPSQKAFADARLDGRADVRLCDYRHSGGRYASVVSIEMVEAVGERYWPTFFATLKDRLAEGGKAMRPGDHRLGRLLSPVSPRHRLHPPLDLSRRDAALQPGDRRPSGSSGPERGNALRLRPRLRPTCRIWATRLVDRSARLTALGYGGPTLRHWRYYLEACAACFAVGRTDVVQVELSHA